MNKGLSSNRTGYNSSSSLYGGDITMTDDDLDSYWTNGAGKKGSGKKKNGGAKRKDAPEAGSSKNAQQHKKKLKVPNGFVNLGYGLVDESTSSVFSGSKVQGVCTVLEKSYLRLTSAADPALVRSPAILQQALTMVKRKWIETQDYEYCCDQLKSIRQDCTVQHLRNTFTVEVYETHARIALESNDYQEFAQCQTQLQLLYKDGHSNGFDRECEFAAYKILYACLMTGPSDSGLVSFMNGLNKTYQSHEAVKHALSVRSSLLTTNYHSFFSSWAAAPNMSGYLMDPLADSMRVRSARILISAYRPKLSVLELTHLLAFDRDEETLGEDSHVPSVQSQRECLEYLQTKFEGLIVFTKEPNPDGLGPPRIYVDCKATFDKLQPTNAAHKLPINSGRAKHTISSSSSSASPMHAPIAAPHDVATWIKRDAVGSTGRIALGRIEGSSPSMKPLSLSSSGQPTRMSISSFSPSPTMSPTPSPPPILDDPVSKKRRNSQPLSAMSYDELKESCDELEATLLDPQVKEKFDDFNLQLMMSRLKALQKQLKKTKKPKA